MGDVIPLRQYTPVYGPAYATVPGSSAVRAYRPGPAHTPSRASAPPRPRPTASSYAPRGPRTFADRLGLAGLRLTRRGRVVLVLLAMLVVAPMATWGATAVASSPGEPTEVRVHAVQPGETLWGFAEQIAEPGEDVRQAVARLQDLNEMTSGTVRVGELLLLPKE
ncbi:LysM peptidoglycan-binding domain-containing protein [Promicromonospora sp. NPDC090134]|uniref:LysM peptidoglycan-binding domain-containing protein n=1 Tax=Promicromonospora sp. NPDC090134 TaxID=3364408 RepID=UPI003804CDC7